MYKMNTVTVVGIFKKDNEISNFVSCLLFGKVSRKNASASDMCH